MSTLQRPARLYQRGNMWWFRAKVPADLTDIIGRREYRFSLKTRSLARAITLERDASRTVDAEIAAARRRRWTLPRGVKPELVSHLSAEQIAAVARRAPPGLLRLPWAEWRTRGSQPLEITRAVDRVLKINGYILPTTNPSFQDVARALADVFLDEPKPLWQADAPVGQLSLGDLIAEYEAAKGAGWNAKTRRGYATTFRILREVLGTGHPVRAIDREQIDAVRQCLEDLPPNVRNRPDLAGLTLLEAAAAARRLDWPRLKARSVASYLTNAHALFGWARQKGYIAANPVPRPAATGPAGGHRAFEPAELQRLFTAPLYAGCRDDRNGFTRPGPNRPRRGRFWVPLIALFTGMPLNTACTLSTDDCRLKDGRWTVRADTAAITLPRLFSGLGWDALVEAAQANTDALLFPELPRGVSGYHSDPFSKWFGRLLTSRHLTDPDLSFQSLRLTYRDAVRAQDGAPPLEHLPGLSLDHLYTARAGLARDGI